MVAFLRKSVSMTVTFILGALTFIAAMAWNDTVKELVNNNPSLKQHGVMMYALIITGISILITIVIGPFQFINDSNCACKDTS
jgi:uncharacterized membrane protein